MSASPPGSGRPARSGSASLRDGDSKVKVEICGTLPPYPFFVSVHFARLSNCTRHGRLVDSQGSLLTRKSPATASGVPGMRNSTDRRVLREPPGSPPLFSASVHYEGVKPAIGVSAHCAGVSNGTASWQCRVEGRE